jgi:hypothetical protein
MENKNSIKKGVSPEEKITRKEALKKAGITALAAASLVFLDTQASAKKSKVKPPKPGRP